MLINGLQQNNVAFQHIEELPVIVLGTLTKRQMHLNKIIIYCASYLTHFIILIYFEEHNPCKKQVIKLMQSYNHLHNKDTFK